MPTGSAERAGSVVSRVQVPDTLGVLFGRWRASRHVQDRRGGGAGVFSGSVVLTPDGTYDETGRITWGGHTGPAGRRLNYHRLPDATVAVHFADARFFVDLDLRTGAWRSVHRCGADTYVISTEVASPDRVVERWQVRGPHKDYDAETTLVRVGAAQLFADDGPTG